MAACAHLTLRRKEELRRFAFLPVRHAFLGGGRCDEVLLVESITSCQREIELLGGAFIEEVTAIVGSARCEVSINIGGLSGCRPFRILPLLSPLFPLHLLVHLRHNTFSSGEIRRGIFHHLARCR